MKPIVRRRASPGCEDRARASLPIGRRQFIVLVGAAAAYVTLRPHVASARRVARAGSVPTLQPWTVSEAPPGNPVDLARALIGAAVLAPSDWNTQPWRFEVDLTSLRLVADAGRALPVTDPERRHMMIALGAALENLLIAARANGLHPTVTYFPHEGARGVVADVAWAPGERARDRAFFAAIPERCTNRRNYDGRGLLSQSRAQLSAQIPEGFNLHWMDDDRPMRALSDLAFETTRATVLDHRAQSEQYRWIRFGDGEARRRGDGVTLDALDLGGPARWMAGRYFNPESMWLRFGATSAAKQVREGIRSSGALALLTGTHHTEAEWLLGGQAFERFALQATQLGLALQPVSAPLQRERVETLRRFAAPNQEPIALLRIGHAKKVPHTPRRSVALVASFRNT